eukprot:30485-Pelagococcus_subviridis.AAC.2
MHAPDRPSFNVRHAAEISIGSPSDVPVPCVDTYRISFGSIAASAKAFNARTCCDGPNGAVNVEARPSWFTDEPLNVMKAFVDILLTCEVL